MTLAQAQNYFTDIYLKFTHLYSSMQVAEDEPGLRIPEKTIRCIWNDQLFKTGQLATTGGEKLEVVFPGFWNFGSGPDFTNALIRVEGKNHEGDVELHVYSTDWKAHGHSDNPDYDRVILHVFMWRGRGRRTGGKTEKVKTPRIPGAHIFELELKDFLQKGIIQLNDQLDFDNYPVFNKFNTGRCHQPLARLPRDKLAFLLNAAGDARIFTKMDRFHDRIICHGYEQAFYEGVAEALGYPVNKEPFRNLAETLPLTAIRERVSGELKPADRVLHIQALLFGTAGLIGFKALDPMSLPAGDRKYFNTLKRLWKKLGNRLPASPLQERHWSFSGIRPANYPYRRIAGLAHLLNRHWTNGMFSDYLKNIQSAISISGDKGYNLDSKTARKTHRFFCVEARDYWAGHYTAGGKQLSRPQQLVGVDRSRAVTINIAIPIGLIYARASKSVSLEACLSLLFQCGKSAPDNKWIRFMKNYILGNKNEMIQLLATDKETQGLMQVYQDYCTQNENNCFRCQFPEVVARYFS